MPKCDRLCKVSGWCALAHGHTESTLMQTEAVEVMTGPAVQVYRAAVFCFVFFFFSDTVVLNLFILLMSALLACCQCTHAAIPMHAVCKYLSEINSVCKQQTLGPSVLFLTSVHVVCHGHSRFA